MYVYIRMYVYVYITRQVRLHTTKTVSRYACGCVCMHNISICTHLHTYTAVAAECLCLWHPSYSQARGSQHCIYTSHKHINIHTYTHYSCSGVPALWHPSYSQAHGGQHRMKSPALSLAQSFRPPAESASLTWVPHRVHEMQVARAGGTPRDRPLTARYFLSIYMLFALFCTD